MKNQPPDFTRQGVTLRRRISPRRFSGDHNVSQKIRKFTTGGLAGPAAYFTSCGFRQDRSAGENLWKRSAFFTLPIRPRERENIRWTHLAPIGCVQRRDRPVLHKADIKFTPPQLQLLPQLFNEFPGRAKVKANLILMIDDHRLRSNYEAPGIRAQTSGLGVARSCRVSGERDWSNSS